jgi:uncharacterized protein (UPF0548 family)
VTEVTYADVGATLRVPLPKGYDHLHYRTPLGSGPDVFATAVQAVLTFRMHRAAGVRVNAEAWRADKGGRLTVGIGPFTVPCEVVYTIDEPRRGGFGYGTLPGHQESGEEAFLVERDAHDRVWFRMIAFSRPARWPALLGGPLTMIFQRVYARQCARALKRLVASSRTVGS